MIEDSNPWKILSSDKIYENSWISLTEHQVLNPSGGEGIYGIVNFKNIAIGIIALDDENHIYLVGQYRLAINKYSWEIPEGGGALDISPLSSAQRELLEETGLVAKNWKEFLKMHLSNSVSDELSIIYLATDLSQHEAQPEETEKLSVKKITIDDAYQLVNDGIITDSISVASILKLKLYLLEL